MRGRLDEPIEITKLRMCYLKQVWSFLIGLQLLIIVIVKQVEDQFKTTGLLNSVCLSVSPSVMLRVWAISPI